MTTPATPLPLFITSPINILSQNGDTVTMAITNPYPGKLHSLFFQYKEGLNVKCLEKPAYPACPEPVTVTVSCIAGRNATHHHTAKFAVVDFFMVDSVLIDPLDNATIPECCHEDKTKAPALAEIPTAVYSYKVSCEPCPTTLAPSPTPKTCPQRPPEATVASRRLLRSGR